MGCRVTHAAPLGMHGLRQGKHPPLRRLQSCPADGQRLAGIPIVDPGAIGGAGPVPIVISSRRSQDEIRLRIAASGLGQRRDPSIPVGDVAQPETGAPNGRTGQRSRTWDLMTKLTAHLAAVAGTVSESSEFITDLVRRLCSCFEQGGELLVCGNGGSAADAQHLAAEFMNRFGSTAARCQPSRCRRTRRCSPRFPTMHLTRGCSPARWKPSEHPEM